jgi:hypothetical protein
LREFSHRERHLVFDHPVQDSPRERRKSLLHRRVVERRSCIDPVDFVDIEADLAHPQMFEEIINLVGIIEGICRQNRDYGETDTVFLKQPDPCHDLFMSTRLVAGYPVPVMDVCRSVDAQADLNALGRYNSQ